MGERGWNPLSCTGILLGQTLVVLCEIDHGFVAVFPLDKQVARVFRTAFLEPHVVVDVGSYDFPLMSKLVRDKVAVRLKGPSIIYEEVGDVSGVSGRRPL